VDGAVLGACDRRRAGREEVASQFAPRIVEAGVV
jgi:hypothetical protein